MEIRVNVIAGGFLILVVFFFIHLLRRSKGGGATQLSMMAGTTDLLLNKDDKKAIETIVDLNAHKKTEEQSAFAPSPDENQKRLNAESS